MSLTACIIVHNDEVYLERCLQSLVEVCEEILVVHDGPCQDSSLEIAQRFGAQVHVRPFVGSSEGHRAFSFEMAKSEWVMRIDPDEYLPPATIAQMPGLLARSDVDAYALRWPASIRGDYVSTGPFSRNVIRCLFRRSRMCFLGITHLAPFTYGKLEVRQDVLLEHRPNYENWSFATFGRKFLPWSRIEAKQLMDFERAPNFQMGADHPEYQRCARRRESPIWSCFDELVGATIYMLKDGLLTAGPDNWRMACFRLLRIASVYWYIVKLKLGPYGRRGQERREQH